MKLQINLVALMLLLALPAKAQDQFVPFSPGIHNLSGGFTITIKIEGQKITYIFTGPNVHATGTDPNYASFILKENDFKEPPIIYWEEEKKLLWWTQGDFLRMSNGNKHGFPTTSKDLATRKTDNEVPPELREKL